MTGEQRRSNNTPAKPFCEGSNFQGRVVSAPRLGPTHLGGAIWRSTHKAILRIRLSRLTAPIGDESKKHMEHPYRQTCKKALLEPPKHFCFSRVSSGLPNLWRR